MRQKNNETITEYAVGLREQAESYIHVGLWWKINLTRKKIVQRTGKLVMNVGRETTLLTSAITSDTGVIIKKRQTALQKAG